MKLVISSYYDKRYDDAPCVHGEKFIILLVAHLEIFLH